MGAMQILTNSFGQKSRTAVHADEYPSPPSSMAIANRSVRSMGKGKTFRVCLSTLDLLFSSLNLKEPSK